MLPRQRHTGAVPSGTRPTTLRARPRVGVDDRDDVIAPSDGQIEVRRGGEDERVVAATTHADREGAHRESGLDDLGRRHDAAQAQVLDRHEVAAGVGDPSPSRVASRRSPLAA